MMLISELKDKLENANIDDIKYDLRTTFRDSELFLFRRECAFEKELKNSNDPLEMDICSDLIIRYSKEQNKGFIKNIDSLVEYSLYQVIDKTMKMIKDVSEAKNVKATKVYKNIKTKYYYGFNKNPPIMEVDKLVPILNYYNNTRSETDSNKIKIHNNNILELLKIIGKINE